METTIKLNYFILSIMILLFSGIVFAQEMLPKNVIQIKNYELIKFSERNFYFDIIPYFNEYDFIMLSFSNEEQRLLNLRNTYQRELKQIIDDSGQDIQYLKDNSYEYIRQVNLINAIDLTLPPMINPQWISIHSFQDGSLHTIGKIRIGNFDYVIDIPSVLSYGDGVYLCYFKNPQEVKNESPILKITSFGPLFQRLDTIQKSEKNNIYFFDYFTSNIYNINNELVAYIEKPNHFFKIDANDKIIALHYEINPVVTGILATIVQSDDDKRPPLPYNSLYYYSSSIMDKVVKLEALSDIGEHDEYLPTIFDAVSPNEGDIITFGKPVIYNNDSILYWYAIKPVDNKKLTVYVLVCYDNGSVYYIDACLVYHKYDNFYEVRLWESDTWIKTEWTDTWSIYTANQMLGEDTHVMPLVGLDSQGKIICYNPFREQLVRFEL